MLTGKKIIVTGAASGIGEETARRLKNANVKVIAVDRNEPKIEVDEFVKVDLTNEVELNVAIEKLCEIRADGLANIAGVPPTQPVEVVLTVNLIALKKLTLGIVDSMSDNSSIVNLASLAGIGWEQEIEKIKATSSLTHDNVSQFCKTYQITPENCYFFSKQALIAWTHENRWTWRDRGIRMNSVSPGPVETPILPDFLKTLGKRAEEDSKTMDRPGKTTDIAPAVVFLLSDDSIWIRGSNIAVDGGMRANIDATSNGLK